MIIEYQGNDRYNIQLPTRSIILSYDEICIIADSIGFIRMMDKKKGDELLITDDVKPVTKKEKKK